MQRRVVAGVLAVLTLAVTACGGTSKAGPSGPPSSVVADAISSMAKGGTVTLSLYGSGADFAALGGGTPSAKDQALADKLIPDSSITATFDASSASNPKAGIDVKIGGEDQAADLLIVNSTLYLKVDLKGIGASTGINTSKLSTEGNALAADLPFLKALLAGQYISADLKQLEALVKLGEGFLGGSAAPATTATTVAGGVEQQIVTALRNALTNGTTITQVGSDSVGTRYQVVVMPQTFVQSLAASAQGLLGPLASKASSIVSKVPNTPVTLDAWVSGGQLKQLELDLRQFHQGTGGPANPLGVKAVFSTSTGPFSAPSGATVADLTKLGALLGSLAGSSGTSGSSGTP